MRTIWYSLAWKEWHEHKWKLLALTVVLCGVNALLLREQSRETLGACFWMTTVVVMPLAMFLGVGAAAGERSRHTAEFLAALPVPTWRVAFVKLLAGLTVLCIAIAATYVLMSWWATSWRLSHTHMERLLETAWQVFPQHFSSGNWFVAGALATTVVAASIFVWTAAAGLNRPDEVSAAAKAALVMISWWGLLLLVALQLDKGWFEGPARKLIAAVVMASPGGAAVRIDYHSATKWAASSFPAQFGFATHLCIAAWFIYAYSRVSRGGLQWKGSSFDVEELMGWLGPPGQSPIAAIAWKQFRESAPVVLAGVGAALLIATLYLASNWSNRWNASSPSFLAVFAEVSGAIIAVFSIFIALVVGVGAGLVDLSPPLNHFWRSRPINPDAWFWTKFVAGLLVLIVTLLIPVFLLAAIARHYGSTNLWDTFGSLQAWALIGMNLSLYTSAMAMTCLVRQPIYGAILGIAALFVGPLLVGISLEIFSGIGGQVWKSLSATQINTINTSSIAVVVAATLVVGWLAMRNDWGWKK